MSNEGDKKPIGGGFLAKKDRNENLRRYHKAHPEMTHTNLARVFRISRARVTQILGGQRELEDGSTEGTITT